jgi:hypothetical protein
VVGSANLTRPGITRNAELVRSFSFEVGKRELALPLFQSARAFLGEVASRWPSTEFSNRLAEVDTDITWLNTPAPGRVPARLLHNLDGPLLPQLVAGLESPVHELAVVSPFFDEEPLLLEWIQEHVSPKRVTIFTRNGAPTLTPSWLTQSMMKAGTAKLLFSNWSEDEHSRQLHGKALALVHGKSVRLAFGSANFTRAALLSTAVSGNVEVVLALDDVPRKSIDVRRLFDPNGDAKEGPLISSMRPPEEPISSHTLRLSEATLEATSFRCLLATEYGGHLEAVLLFQDGGENVVAVTGSGTDRQAELRA